MRGCATTLIEPADENCQDWASQSNDSQQPEAIEKAGDCGLPLNQCIELRDGVDRGVGGRKSFDDECVGEAVEQAAKNRI